MSYQYQLSNGRTLYYSPLHCRFRMDDDVSWEEPIYANTDLNYIRLEISHACNGNCNYCIVFGNEIQNFACLNISELWDWLISQTWFEKITGIFIIGGEPLLFFDAILFLMDQFEGDIHFSTNGTLITKEMAEKLKERDVLVYLSLDGLTRMENRNRVYRNGQPMYDDILRGLSCLEEVGTRKGIFMVATQENISNIAETMEKLSEKYHLLRIGYSLPHWTIHEKNIVTAEQYRDALCALYRNKTRIKASVMQINWRLSPLINGIAKQYSCALHTEQMTILPDRSIVRCSKIDHDTELQKITNQELSAGCPTAIYKDAACACSSCIALGSCGGGCPYDGLKRFGTIIDQRECVITPAVISWAIQDIVYKIGQMDSLPAGFVDIDVIKSVLD